MKVFYNACSNYKNNSLKYLDITQEFDIMAGGASKKSTKWACLPDLFTDASSALYVRKYSSLVSISFE